MQFKLDENLGRRGQRLLEDAGHDASTVSIQGLEGTVDDVLIEVCRVEERVLITLDLDFANPVHYPAAKYAGIIVLRPTKDPKHEDILECLKIMIRGLQKIDNLFGKLWVVSKTQIREYAPNRD